MAGRSPSETPLPSMPQHGLSWLQLVLIAVFTPSKHARKRRLIWTPKFIWLGEWTVSTISSF
jgi:hypothetical protein